MELNNFKIKALQCTDHQGKTTHTSSHVKTQTCTQTKRSLSHTIPHTYTHTHTHTHTHTQRQRSECWLLPVGLWSLNCLSDSSLSKFTMRDSALCLPQLLQLKHTQRKKHTHIHNQRQTHRQTRTHTHWWKHTPNCCTLASCRSFGKVGFGFYPESNIQYCHPNLI